MFKLIKLEWSKFSKNTVITLLFIFFLLFFPALLYFGSIMPENLPPMVPSKTTFYSFPGIWEYLGYAGTWVVYFFLGVLVIYTVTIEVVNKTLRQAIINGMTRNEFFASKFINVLLLASLATIYYVIIALAIGFYNTDGATLSAALENEWAIPRFFLMSLAYMSFALFFAYVFRKSGIAVFSYLSFVLLIEPLIKWLSINYIHKSRIFNFLPMNATEDLMPFPFFKFADSVPNEIDFEFLLTYTEASITVSLYIVLAIGISYWLFTKKDI